MSLQQIVSLVKNETPDDPNAVKQVQFWNYDRVENLSFRKRYAKIVSRGAIREVPTMKIANEAELFQYHQQFVETGFEGTMVRSGGDEPYRMKHRSPTLLKYKDFVDDEFEIVGTTEGKGKAEGQAVITCKTKDGKEFSVRCKGTDAYRKEQWKNRKALVGQKLTVQYQNLSDSGTPLFPVGIVVRSYE